MWTRLDGARENIFYIRRTEGTIPPSLTTPQTRSCFLFYIFFTASFTYNFIKFHSTYEKLVSDRHKLIYKTIIIKKRNYEHPKHLYNYRTVRDHIFVPLLTTQPNLTRTNLCNYVKQRKLTNLIQWSVNVITVMKQRKNKNVR